VSPISRSSYNYAPVPETDETLALMTVIDDTYMECPWYDSRQMARHLRRAGHAVGRRRTRRLRAKKGLAPIYQRPRTSDPHAQHRIYPYLLRKLVIERSNHVWCADVTYIPMRRGFLYLVAIMDQATRKVLANSAKSTIGGGALRWTGSAGLLIARTPPLTPCLRRLWRGQWILLRPGCGGRICWHGRCSTTGRMGDSLY
jgi:hypothetical protein